MAYNLFISHSWTYNDAYEKFCNLLDNQNLEYKNYSVPKDDPIHNADNDKELREAIAAQIRPASVVIVLAGVYAIYSKWIKIEIALAQQMGKKIIAVEPFGAERTSEFVKDNADVIVAWRGDLIVNAIKS